jgi:hypothetical protein
MAQIIKQPSKSAKSMRCSADLLLRVYRSKDFISPIDFQAPAHPGLFFSAHIREPRPSPTWGGALGAALLQRAPVNIAKQAYGLWDR